MAVVKQNITRAEPAVIFNDAIRDTENLPGYLEGSAETAIKFAANFELDSCPQAMGRDLFYGVRVG